MYTGMTELASKFLPDSHSNDTQADKRSHQHFSGNHLLEEKEGRLQNSSSMHSAKNKHEGKRAGSTSL